MKYRNIANTLLTPSAICLGTDYMGSKWDEAYSFRLLDEYTALGGCFVDTAHVYGQTYDYRSRSELTVGKWLRRSGKRGNIILSTKGAHYDISNPDHRRVTPNDIAYDCECSLRDLNTSYIDIYWLHRDDDTLPVEPIIDALNKLVRAGKVRALGASNWSPERIAKANLYAAESTQQGFIANQPQWSLARQIVKDDPTLIQMDAEMYEYHLQSGIAAIPYSSQAKGFYSKLDAGGVDALSPKALSRFSCPENNGRLPRIRQLAEKYNVSTAAVAIAYLSSQPFPTFPIVGLSKPEYMVDVALAADLTLTPDEVLSLRNMSAEK